jgi:hypothetical protein
MQPYSIFIIFVALYIVSITDSFRLAVGQSHAYLSVTSLLSSRRSFNSDDDKKQASPTRGGKDGGGIGKTRISNPFHSSATSNTVMIRNARYSRALRDELSDIICSVDIKANNYPAGKFLCHFSFLDKFTYF